MSYEIRVPELSESVVEATVSEWLKQEGDEVKVGDVLVVLETDKVSLEVAAERAGVLETITRQADEDVVAGEVLGIMDTGDGAGAATASTAPAQADVPIPAVVTRAAAAAQAGETKATPVAKRVAAAHDVDISQVASSGGKVTKADVEQYVSQQSTPPAPSAPAQRPPASNGAPPVSTANGRQEERIKMSRRRRTIATRLVEAQQTAAMLTTFNEVDMHNVMQLRKRRKDAFKEKFGVSLGLSSFFVKAVIGALKQFPRLNAEIQGTEMVLKHYYDIGIAIGDEEGLIVPVLRDADRLSFSAIEKQIRVYAQQIQDGNLPIDALRGGTFTITNGGVFGSLLSTPILNPPQVGILGLHGIKERPMVIDGEILVRPMMYLALTYDHRIVDGREAVQFLVAVKDLIEDPETMLLEG
ncbi:MAG: 2-oxoglutarate dehydrogenase complex dihydrolipoyllysine-residue succinyltransferase [Chloroflexi bacterium]|nr:2-oxoglutarate dehydrogenase complex dihydrolipoyllysine-residue succinyltransferase [Chloroflexota bacterium]